MFQNQAGAAIIDQYRAHQRVLFEQYLTQIKQQHALSQQLLFPIHIALTTHELNVIQSSEEMLFQLGFDLDIQPEGIEIKALPTGITQEQAQTIIEDMMQQEFQEKA